MIYLLFVQARARSSTPNNDLDTNVHLADGGKAQNAGRGEALNGVVETIKEEEEEEENGHIGNGV